MTQANAYPKAALPNAKVEELRLSKPRRMYATNLRSAIDKRPRPSVDVTKLGLVGDAQVASMHGGEERAVLQADLDQYELLKKAFPESAHLFRAGGLGENIVARGMNERNMCIGDIVEVGSVVLQVTQSRPPCAQLKYRFNEPTMPRYLQDNALTGWFYRVLQEGRITTGDAIAVTDRPHPEWPIAKVQHYLYIETDNKPATEELAHLGLLAAAARDVFQHRIESNEIEDWDLRLTSDSWVIEPPNGTSEISVKVARIIEDFPGTKRFVLNPTGSEPLPTFAAGAHIAIQLPTGLLRTYSLCAPADNGGSYQIAVALAPDSRGGSKYLHESVEEGDVLTISPPANLFEMSRGRHQVFIAAGIGITPFFSMIAEAEANGESFELHYCVDDTADYPFKSELSAQGERVRVYSLDESLDVGALLDEVRAEQTHVYACGSPGFVDLIRDEARHWDDENVHYENFSVDQSNAKPFVVTIRETGQEIKVDADTSLLDALRDSHLHVESDCEVGICGTCRVRYTGAVDHKDTYLTKSEKREWMTSCVSRAKGAELQISLR